MPLTKLTVEEVTELVEGQLGKKAPPGGVTPDLPLADSGLSSLDLTDIFLELEERLGIEVDTEDAFYAKTARELVDAINAAVDIATSETAVPGTPTHNGNLQRL